MRYKFTLSIGYSSAIQEEYFTLEEMGVSDDLPPEELEIALEKEWQIWTNNYIAGGWDAIKDNQQ